MKTKRLVTDALCAAIYVVLANLVGLNLGPMKLSLDGFPILLSAVLFGPIDGFIIGFLGNFISQMLGPYGLSATTVLWALPPAVLGLFVGIGAKKLGERTLRVKAIGLLVFFGLLVDTTLTTGVMWVDCLVYQYSFVTYAPYIVWRYAADVIKAVIYALLLPPVARAIGKEQK